MVADREMHQTLLARQSRLLLSEMMVGLWDLMELLDLNELESDVIVEQMLDFTGSGDETSKTHTDFVPKRTIDSDILWLKLEARGRGCDV